MDKSIQISEYGENDFISLRECINDFEDYYASLGKRETRSPEFGNEFTPALIEQVYNNEGKIFVAKQNNNVIGFIAGHRENQSLLQKIVEGEKNTGILQELFVQEAYRKNNIGKNLAERLEKYFKSKNCNEIKIQIDSYNSDVSNFYQKVGYVESNICFSKSL